MTQKDPTNHLGLNDGLWHEVQSHHAGLSAPDYEFRERPGQPFIREIREVLSCEERQ